MPKFNKTEDQLETMFDKWLFVLRNLSRLLERPAALQERVFEKLFKQAEIAKFSPEERQDYEESVKIYRDLKNSLDTAEWKAKVKIAKNLRAMGLSNEQIAKGTGLPIDEILSLWNLESMTTADSPAPALSAFSIERLTDLCNVKFSNNSILGRAKRPLDLW